METRQPSLLLSTSVMSGLPVLGENILTGSGEYYAEGRLALNLSARVN
jgi:hypothetical protein